MNAKRVFLLVRKDELETFFKCLEVFIAQETDVESRIQYFIENLFLQAELFRCQLAHVHENLLESWSLKTPRGHMHKLHRSKYCVYGVFIQEAWREEGSDWELGLWY